MVYADNLKTAINDPDIFTIAVTGDTGIGKTSVIKSYLNNNYKQKFASISLAEYNTEYCTVKNDNSGDSEKNKEIRQRLEKSMLRQILALCRRRDVRYSSLELVPEEANRIKAVMTGLLIAVYSLMWIIELNSKRVSDYIHMLLKMHNADVSLYFMHMFFDALLVLITGFLIFLVVKRIILRFRINEISAKFGSDIANVSTSAERNPVFSLEEYRMELIYIFEKISLEYNAIVFEDMDRIHDGTAIEILTYLREINTSVNKRIKRRFRSSHRKICFIFVINEDMVSKFDYHKYIDYGLSIIPTLSQENAMDSVDLLLKDLSPFMDNRLEKWEPYCSILIKLFTDIPTLCDFRTIFQIKNDYNTFYKALFYGNNATSRFLPNCNYINLLSFMIYKNLLPDDYSNIRRGKSILFPIKKFPTCKNMENTDISKKEKIYKTIAEFLKSSSVINNEYIKEKEKPTEGTDSISPIAEGAVITTAEKTEEAAEVVEHEENPTGEESPRTPAENEDEDEVVAVADEGSPSIAGNDTSGESGNPSTSVYPDNSCYLGFIGFSEKEKREKCKSIYFSEDSSVSGTSKSEFFKEDMKGERLTLKILQGMSNEKKLKALSYIQDAYLLILLQEYVDAKDNIMGNHTKQEADNAKSLLLNFLTLITQNKDKINKDTKTEADHKALTKYLEKNFVKIDYSHAEKLINEYYKVMGYNERFEANRLIGFIVNELFSRVKKWYHFIEEKCPSPDDEKDQI
jgi:hypothetical protein